jgi:hypothetical protein
MVWYKSGNPRKWEGRIEAILAQCDDQVKNTDVSRWIIEPISRRSHVKGLQPDNRGFGIGKKTS